MRAGARLPCRDVASRQERRSWLRILEVVRVCRDKSLPESSAFFPHQHVYRRVPHFASHILAFNQTLCQWTPKGIQCVWSAGVSHRPPRRA